MKLYTLLHSIQVKCLQYMTQFDPTNHITLEELAQHLKSSSSCLDNLPFSQSKMFLTAWHQIFCKQSTPLFKDYFVLMSNYTSECTKMAGGVSQGSILSLLLFSIYTLPLVWIMKDNKNIFSS